MTFQTHNAVMMWPPSTSQTVLFGFGFHRLKSYTVEIKLLAQEVFHGTSQRKNGSGLSVCIGSVGFVENGSVKNCFSVLQKN